MRLPLLLVALLAACDSAELGSRSIRLDTLAGYTLGSLQPEARAQAEGEGRLLECFTADDLLLCSEQLALRAGRDGIALDFRNGRLVTIARYLGEDWKSVPFDTLRGRLRPYGVPADLGPTLKWTTSRGPHVFRLDCGRAQSAQCMVSVSEESPPSP